MRKIISLFLVVASVLALASCATAGNTNADNSLMIVYTERPPVDTNELYVYFSMKGENFSFKIDPKKLYQQVNTLKPGSYTVKNATAMYYENDSVAGLFPMSFSFKLEQNTVSVLPLKFETEMIKTADGREAQSFNFAPLTPEEFEKTKEFIASNKRYDGLAVKIADMAK